MRNIRKSLRVVFQAGKQIGKMFMKLFPGMQQFMKGLKNLFSPKKFKGLMGDVKKIFKSFFLDLNKDLLQHFIFIIFCNVSWVEQYVVGIHHYTLFIF